MDEVTMELAPIVQSSELCSQRIYKYRSILPTDFSLFPRRYTVHGKLTFNV